MWPPQNIQDLPLRHKIQQIKEEISFMERQIADAQFKIEALRKSVAERKAWIAPIRKLPHEVLSQIFVEVSMESWEAPLTLQGVCRWWRDVVMGSPRAWTFIPLFNCDKAGLSELCSLFIERGRDTTLHLYMGAHNFLPQLKILAPRVECLYFHMTFSSMTYFLPSEYDFTRLEHLKLVTNQKGPDPNSIFNTPEWNMMCFPNLKFLELVIWDPLLLAIAASPQFPPIRHLAIMCEDPSPLTDILVKCANSLEYIHLIYRGLPTRPPITTQTIHFPFLGYIRLADYTRGTRFPWYFEGSTPNLEAYVDQGDWPTTDTFKFDTSNVTFLQVINTPDLSRFPRLVTLRIMRGEEDLIEATNLLKERPQYSPELAAIEYSGYISNEGLEEAKAALLTRAEETGRPVKIGEVDWVKDAEGRPCWILEPCPEYMPCNSDFELSD